MKITILHLSDLHLADASEHDQRVVLEALFTDIELFSNSGTAFDAIAFTGDLVGKGQFTPSTESWALNEVFPRILAASKVSPDRLFLVPGNHDMELPKRDSFWQPSLDNLKSKDQVNTFIDEVDIRPVLWAHLKSFDSLRGRISKASPVLSNALFQAFSFEKQGIKVGIGCINSAWKASGKPNDYDCGCLLVGERQVERIAGAIKDCDLKIALMHHPLNYLLPYDFSCVQRAISMKFDALFHGHNHVGDAVNIAHVHGSLFCSNAGCLYQHRDYFNEYSVIEYDTNVQAWTVWAREYFNGRQCFDKCIRFAADGTKSYQSSKTTSGQVVRLPSDQYLATIEEKVSSLMLAGTVSAIAPKKLNALFVEPILRSVSERKVGPSEDTGSSRDTRSLRDLFASPAATLIIGPKESGRTTLLAYFCANANSQDFSPKPAFGVYANVDALRTYSRASLLEAVVQFGAGEYKRSEFIAFLKEGRVTLCLDNVDLKKDEHVSLVRNFIQEFPKNKYVLSALENVETSIGKSGLPQICANLEIAYIHSFGRRQTRQLAEKWFGESANAARERVDKILDLLHRLNVPRTPFLITILLWIEERKIPFSPVNQAALIDTFVDGLLEKLYESKSRAATDATIKRHFLSELALHMHRQGTRILTRLDLETFTVEYFAAKVLKNSALTLLQEFYDKGVLLELGDEVCFKFDCFRSFFLASRLETAMDLYDEAMSVESFDNLAEEIDLFTGLRRDRKDMLEKFLTIVEALHESVSLDLSPSVFDEIDAEGSPLLPEKREMIMQALVSKRPSPEQQEELLETIDEDALRVSGEDARTGRTQPGVRAQGYSRFVSALQVCSVVLRNSELVNDAKLKHYAYERLINWWAEILIGVVLSVELADEAMDDAFKPFIQHMSPEAAKHFMKMATPMVILALVRESLGTPKLEAIMADHLEGCQHNVQRIVDTFIYVDLELPQYIDKLKALATRVNSRYELELIFFKLFGILMVKNVSEHQAREMGQVVADVFARISSSGNSRLDKARKQEFLEKLSKLALVQKARNSS